MNRILCHLWWVLAVLQAYNLGTADTLSALSDYRTPDTQIPALALTVLVAVSWDVLAWMGER